MDTNKLQEIKRFVAAERQTIVTRMERLDILRLQVGLREDNITDVARELARWLGRGDDTIKSTLKMYLDTSDVHVATAPANTSKHKTRVPHAPAVTSSVQQFIRDRCIMRTRTVARDVLALLEDHKIVTINKANTRDYASCLRVVQAFLAKEVYKHGTRKGHTTYRLTDAHKLVRDQYMQYMVPTVTLRPCRPVVYLDESFVHRHYARHKDSLYDPEDMDTTKPKHKGCRYCFIAGILHDGSPVSHLVGLDIFVGGKKNGKVIEDYHSRFTHDYFVDWFSNLLDEIEDLGYLAVVFVMDNAKYHKGKPATTPKGNSKKEAMLQACVDFGFDNVASTDLKSTLWAKLKAHADSNVLPVIVEMARLRGHDVVYAASKYSDLQPIELIWGIVKGVVGRAYTSTTTFQDVYDRLVDAFWNLDSEVIPDTIGVTTRRLLALHADNCAAEASAAVAGVVGDPGESDSDESSGPDVGINDE
ncbi:hypothetical protein ACHHYP_17409 [Achlya hypogyna]|uniref:Tc1-like transposase DDE domain-containing protein n=1 Tax=Achlya hypogyna TaxID=1202772 RepID=A0A1V9Y4I0_ACHHY|nr:hypothetical protein ACHHYP_17409 [Achlya hypogyna]